MTSQQVVSNGYQPVLEAIFLSFSTKSVKTLPLIL